MRELNQKARDLSLYRLQKAREDLESSDFRLDLPFHQMMLIRGDDIPRGDKGRR